MGRGEEKVNYGGVKSGRYPDQRPYRSLLFFLCLDFSPTVRSSRTDSSLTPPLLVFSINCDSKDKQETACNLVFPGRFSIWVYVSNN